MGLPSKQLVVEKDYGYIQHRGQCVSMLKVTMCICLHLCTFVCINYILAHPIRVNTLQKDDQIYVEHYSIIFN